MLIQCEGCAGKYFLPESKVPANPLKVSCPKCRAVFTLVPPPQNVIAGPERSMVSSAAVGTPAGVSSTAVAVERAPVKAPASKKRQKKRSRRGGNDRARRLARVLVSDILCYNQEKRDQALADGTLMAVLGDEIKKSWELYKEKVGQETAKSTNYFKEALNEILADGQEIF